MTRRWKRLLWLAAFLLIAVGIWLVVPADDGKARLGVEQTRNELRQQGFKTGLSDFDLSTPPEVLQRMSVVTNAGFPHTAAPQPGSSSAMLFPLLLDPLQTVGSNSAAVLWRLDDIAPAPDYLPRRPATNRWELLREALGEHETLLNAACTAALSGPIAYSLEATHGSAMLLPHVAGARTLQQILSTRLLVDLHDGNPQAAWTNLAAQTRLVAAWNPEPVEISHLVRFAAVNIAMGATWHALQTNAWSDEQLAWLQNQWATVRLFQGLPETAAFQRACTADNCQRERREPMESGFSLTGLIQSPRSFFNSQKAYWQRVQYRRSGSYEDEKALLLHFRDRELELRRAVQSTTWAQMRSCPGATNPAAFRSRYSSAMQSMLNTRQISLGFQLQGQGLLGRAAQAESWRRLILTALGLERHRLRTGNYPATLQAIASELPPDTWVDFMDGQLLRYQPLGGGHFLLYSVGLDCVDDGGQQPPRRNPVPGSFPPSGLQPGSDLVWPRPASAAEIAQQEADRRQSEEERNRTAEVEHAAHQRQRETARALVMEQLEMLYRQRTAVTNPDPLLKGKPLSQILSRKAAPGSPKPAIDELLTLKQITTGEEPDIATFEVTASYDAVTNLGRLELLVDADPADPDVQDEGAEFQECTRATNGHCLLVWNTTYSPPGRRFLQARLRSEEWRTSTEIDIKGPLALFVSTNVVWFEAYSGMFSEDGAFLKARTAESNALYTLTLSTSDGTTLKTFKGATTNGVIEVLWNLIDERGQRFTNESFESKYDVTFPDADSPSGTTPPPAKK